jgi:hypothetical protein
LPFECNLQRYSAADSGYAIYIDISFKDGKRLWGYTISFDTGTHGWQFKAGVIDPEVGALHVESS